MSSSFGGRLAGNSPALPGAAQVHVTSIQNGGIAPAGSDTTVLLNANPLPLAAVDPGLYTAIFFSSLYITMGATAPTNVTASAHAGAPTNVLDIHTLGPSWFAASTTFIVSLLNDIPPVGYPAPPTGATPGPNFWFSGPGGFNTAGFNPFISLNPTAQAVTLRANSECLCLLVRNADV